MIFEVASVRVFRRQRQSNWGLFKQVWYQTVANKYSYKPIKLQHYKCIDSQVIVP